MGDDPLHVLQQLASNPQLVSQMQSILAIVSPARQREGGGEHISALCSSSRAPSNTTTSNTGTMVPLTASGLSADGPRQRGHWRSPPVEGSSLQRTDFRSDVEKHGGVTFERYERLMARCRELEQQVQQQQSKRGESAGKAQRVVQLEEEVRNLTCKLGNLQDTIDKKDTVLDECMTRHALEVTEVKNAYELRIKNLIEKHKVDMRKLVSGQELVIAARGYQTVVTSNGAVGHSGGTASGAVPSARLEPVATTSTRRVDPTPTRRGANVSHATQHQDGGTLVGATAAESKSISVGSKDSHPIKRQRGADASTTPIRVFKKRNPRTPSYTVADRVSEANEYSKKGSPTVKKEHEPPMKDPVSSDFRGREQQLTAAPNARGTPPHQTPAACTLAEAVGAVRQEVQQQRGVSDRVQLTTRVAPPHRVGGVSPSASSGCFTVLGTPSARGLRRQLRPVSGASSAVGGSTRSPSPVDPKRGATQPRYFVTTSMSEKERSSVIEAIQKLGQRAVVVDGDADEILPLNTTHIVLHGPPRSVKALCGVVSSKWLVQPSYVLDSLGAGFWLDEETEGGLRYFPPPLRCQRFLLTMPEGIVKTMLQRVVEYGGGEVVGTKRNENSTDQDVVVVSSGDELLRFATSRD